MRFCDRGYMLVMDQIALAQQWITEGRRFAMATLVEADGSAPFDAGTFLLVDEYEHVEGSITGGCVEADVVRQASNILQHDEGGRVATYGIADELAQSVGLMCGGTVHVLIRAPGQADARVLNFALAAATRGEPVVVATLLDGPTVGATMALVNGTLLGTLAAGSLLDRNVGADLTGALGQAGSRVRRYGADGRTLGDEVRVHIHSHLPSPRMLIVGAIDYAAALASIAAIIGHRVTITDPRPTFAASSRFSRSAEVIVGWPQDFVPQYGLSEHDAIVVLTHDRKFDEPALAAALASDCGYIGALGSRRTARDRRDRMLARGLATEQFARVHSPCGLDIGARTPEEVAISILAEIIAVRNGRHGGALRAGTGPVRPS
jgi:xanthine dehydrogenase accessory factor